MRTVERHLSNIYALPRHPGAMMAARTAATHLGYVIGAIVGGAVISHGGYATFGIVLAIGMAESALLILGVDDRLEDRKPARLWVEVSLGRFSEARAPSLAAL